MKLLVLISFIIMFNLGFGLIHASDVEIINASALKCKGVLHNLFRLG